MHVWHHRATSPWLSVLPAGSNACANSNERLCITATSSLAARLLRRCKKVMQGGDHKLRTTFADAERGPPCMDVERMWMAYLDIFGCGWLRPAYSWDSQGPAVRQKYRLVENDARPQVAAA